MHDRATSATRFAAALVLLLAASGPALAQANDQHPTPFQLADQGSFFVHRETITSAYPRADTLNEPGRIVVRRGAS